MTDFLSKEIRIGSRMLAGSFFDIFLKFIYLNIVFIFRDDLIVEKGPESVCSKYLPFKIPYAYHPF